MKIYKLYRYYQFGFNYRMLLYDSDDISNKKAFERLTEYLDFLNELNLSVTKSGVEMKGINEIYEEIRKAAEDSNTAKSSVDTTTLKKLHDRLLKIDNILDAELNIKVGFVLDEKRYSNEILTEKIDRIFADGVYSLLPPIAQEDFKEAGLCLAFDRYTAVAYHALRGTEEVLKLYYSKLLNKTPTAKATWGTCLIGINQHIKSRGISPAPSPELMTNLESLREYHRNKTQHPVKIYKRDESQDLLGMCVKTINEIIADLLKRKLL